MNLSSFEKWYLRQLAILLTGITGSMAVWLLIGVPLELYARFDRTVAMVCSAPFTIIFSIWWFLFCARRNWL